MADQNQDQQINIELTEEIAEGTYANLAMVGHSGTEFVLDFIRMMPGLPKAKVMSRVIVTPEHMKRLIHTLQDNMERYEAQFGRVEVAEEGPKFPMHFGGTMGEA